MHPYAQHISIASLAVFVFAAAHVAAEEVYTFEADIIPLVENYCTECHNPSEKEGDLDLERFGTMDMILDSIAIWQRIAKRLESGEMPPKKRPKPEAEEKKIILDWVSSLSLDDSDCNHLASEESASWYPGYVMSRRLNRAEYENTLSDLLGMEIKVAHLFPADGAGGEGFDNNGSALFLSAIQIEKYLDAAELAIEAALPYRPRTGRRARLNGKHAPESPARSTLITASPGWKHDPSEAARRVIHEFAERSWRRPVELEEVERLQSLYEHAYERGDGYEEALKLAFKAILISPHFLFLSEPEPPQMGNYELGDFPLASRLSYFLWASMPDEELLGLARAGKLHHTDVLLLQVQRMLQDPKSRALGEIFATQWLGINQLVETSEPDRERFPQYDEALGESMVQEAALVFNRIVREDRSLLELIDSQYTFVNEALAAIYGLSGVRGDEMRLVEFNDPNRGGVLGMAAMLTSTSQPLRTSPVLRGKWVLERLLGAHVPAPPAEVPKLPDDDVQPDGLSFRARLEAHRTQAECAACHKRMDPIGFGLENFDPIGRWREEQAGQAVDSRGEMPSGEIFSGPAELKKILLKRKDAFAALLAKKTLGYALGRSLTRYDACVVDDCIEALTRTDFRPSALITEIVLSYPFRHRYSGGKL